MAQTLYVNPNTGNDSASGSESNPLKTISVALSMAQSDTTIQLNPGTYNTTSGESFPLKVSSGIKIIGNESNKGQDIFIEGGGDYVSKSAALQNIGILLSNNTELRGVKVTNAERRGTGVWLESSNATIANCTFTNCNREGIQATGTSSPTILDSFFVKNLGQGITFRKTSAGVAQGNTCQEMAAGIDVGDEAAPLLANNTVSGNRFGMTIFSSAKPILRNNLIENNTDDGISVTNNALPDLGTNSEPGGNVFRDNGVFDISNSSSNPLVSVGNSLTLAKISGQVQIADNVADGGDAGSGNQPPDDIATDPDDGDNANPDNGTDNGTDNSGGGDSSPPNGGSGDDDTPPNQLADIQGHWAESFISALFDQDLINGIPQQNGTFAFKPNDRVTRAQYAALLVQAFNPAAKRDAKSFSDVASDFWAADAIQKAYSGEFLSGYPNGTFKPNDSIKRADIIVSLVNGLGLSGSPNNALSIYDDRISVPNYAVDAVEIATAKKMIVNYPDAKRIRGGDGATRAEMASLVHQALVDAGTISAVNSPYIVVYEPGNSSFSDVAGHWAEQFIEAMYQQGFVTGYPDGKFKPNNQITRAQYAALLNQALTLTPKQEAKKFKDVGDDFWGAEAIQKAYQAGFLSGFPDNTFRPNEKTQRVQVLVSLVNGLGLSASSAGASDKYTDSSAIPDYAKEEVETATIKKMVINYPDVNKLSPTNAATRAEVSAMVYQALVDAGTVAAINSNYVVTA